VTNTKKMYQTSPSMSETQAGKCVDICDISTCTWSRVREPEEQFENINVTSQGEKKVLSAFIVNCKY